MTTPTITLYPDTLPAKEQANAAFDTNVDNFMDWLTLTNGPELQTMITYTNDVADNVLATALAGDLPALTGKAGQFIRANAAEDGGEFTADVAPLASPALTGAPTAPTAPFGTSTTQVATTAFVDSALQLMQIQDQKADGVDGGTFTAGGWRKRDLNTVVHNSISGASLSSNDITLPAGTYLIEGFALANVVSTNLTHIRDTSDSSILLVGVTDISSTTISSNSLSHIRGKITLGSTTNIELVHRCLTTRATNGFGLANGFSSSNVYAEIIIRKV
jgi:hypothetical protein